jgi:molecular chaperone DnaJ
MLAWVTILGGGVIPMTNQTHYQTLEVAETATQAEIKQAYRRLVKQFHPDSQTQPTGHDQIARINQAYEVIGDPQRRQVYDRQRQGWGSGDAAVAASQRAQRTADLQDLYRQQRQAHQGADHQRQNWLKQVYLPVDRWVGKVLAPLRAEIRQLSADPFDDELMAAFQTYLEHCRDWLGQARTRLESVVSPPGLAGVTTDLHHCLGQLEDGVEEMERFTLSYEESYLHTGEELFRIARQLRQEARDRLKPLA